MLTTATTNPSPLGQFHDDVALLYKVARKAYDYRHMGLGGMALMAPCSTILYKAAEVARHESLSEGIHFLEQAMECASCARIVHGNNPVQLKAAQEVYDLLDGIHLRWMRWRYPAR